MHLLTASELQLRSSGVNFFRFCKLKVYCTGELKETNAASDPKTALASETDPTLNSKKTLKMLLASPVQCAVECSRPLIHDPNQSNICIVLMTSCLLSHAPFGYVSASWCWGLLQPWAVEWKRLDLFCQPCSPSLSMVLTVTRSRSGQANQEQLRGT